MTLVVFDLKITFELSVKLHVLYFCTFFFNLFLCLSLTITNLLKWLENYWKIMIVKKLVILFLNKLLIMYKLQQPNWPWTYFTLCKSYLSLLIHVTMVVKIVCLIDDWMFILTSAIKSTHTRNTCLGTSIDKNIRAPTQN